MIQPRFFNRLLLPSLLLSALLASCAPSSRATGTPGAPTNTAVAATHSLTNRADPTTGPTVPAVTPTSQAHLQVDPEALRGSQVTFWHPYTGDAATAIDEITAEFNQSNVWGVQAKAVEQGGTDMLDEHVQTALQEDTAPNVIAAGAEQIQAWQAQYKTLIDLSAYANDPRWGLTSQEVADFPPNFWSTGQTDSQHFGLPASRSAQVLFYNQSWAQELGFPNAPSTPEEFYAQACAAAAANAGDGNSENDGTGGWIVSYDNLVMLSWMHGFGLEALPDPQSGAFRFNTTPVKNTFTFLNRLFDNNCAWTSRLPTPYDYFARRNALFYSGAIEEIAVQQRSQQRNGSTDTWTVIPYPTEERKPVVLANDTQYAIPVNSREQQLASWLFIRYLTLPENQAKLARATGSWPASVTAMEQLSDYSQEHPQWGQSLLWVPLAASAPTQPGWLTARNILEDASWNMFQASVKPEDIPKILSILDATIGEVLQKTGN